MKLIFACTLIAIAIAAVACGSRTANATDTALQARTAFVEAENRGDLEALRTLIDADIVYGLPGERPAFGTDAVLELLAVVHERFDWSTRYDVQVVTAGESSVVEHGTVTMQFKPRGGGEEESLTAPCAWKTIRTADGWRVSELLLGSIGPVSELVPQLPAPTGPHRLGVRSMIFEDPKRADPFEPDKPREIGIEIWYPAHPDPAAEPRAYASPEVAHALAAFLDVPLAFSAFMPHVPTHSVANALVLDGPFPVILYNHGYSGFTGVHQTLYEELASHGYVVVSVAHAGESALFVKEDGACQAFDRDGEALRSRMAEAADPAPESAKDRILRADSPAERRSAYRDLLRLSPLHQESTRIWAADCSSVIDELARLNEGTGAFAGRLDLGRIGVIGHSLGGATAGQLAVTEPRVDAGVNLDGFQFGDLIDSPLEIPFMFMGAQRAWAGDTTISNDIFYLDSRKPAWIVLIRGFEHASFTDLPVFSMAPGIGDGPDAGAIALGLQRAYVLAFFDETLRQKVSPTLDPDSPRDAAVYLSRRN